MSRFIYYLDTRRLLCVPTDSTPRLSLRRALLSMRDADASAAPHDFFRPNYRLRRTPPSRIYAVPGREQTGVARSHPTDPIRTPRSTDIPVCYSLPSLSFSVSCPGLLFHLVHVTHRILCRIPPALRRWRIVTYRDAVYRAPAGVAVAAERNYVGARGTGH